MNSDFSISVDDQAIATITWDCEKKSMNVLSFEALETLEKLIDQVINDDQIIAGIITSGKKDFAAGMDLNVLAQLKQSAGENPAEGVFNGVMKMHSVLRKIELAGMDPKTKKGGKPIVSVLPGTALGIGLEIPLSTHRVFSANNPKAKIGLPEILVGLFPGAGGTTRLVRKLGAMAASTYLLEGKTVAPDKALAAGIIDQVDDDPIKAARQWVLNASEGDLIKPWDQKGYKILELDTYFTSGPEETRAWTIQKNCTAPKAAGEIHTDFEKGFIRAETVSYEDFINNNGWVNSKTNGKMRLEGKDYIVKDGDVLNFRFNT